MSLDFGEIGKRGLHVFVVIDMCILVPFAMTNH
jgi:hypothetical protein